VSFSSRADCFHANRRYTREGIADQIRCPTPVCGDAGVAKRALAAGHGRLFVNAQSLLPVVCEQSLEHSCQLVTLVWRQTCDKAALARLH
jgi:hypothetical protein